MPTLKEKNAELEAFKERFKNVHLPQIKAQFNPLNY